MKYLRWALGVLLGLYVLRNLYYFALTVGDKTGAMPLSGANVAFKPLVDSLGWLHVGLWAVAIIGYVVATLRYFRGGKALIPLVVGGAFDAITYMMLRTIPAYQAAPQQVQQIDQLCLIGVLVAVVLTWWTERSSAPASAAAA